MHKPLRYPIQQRADSRNKKDYNPAACGMKTTFTDKMKRQRTMYQMKEQEKTPEKQLNEVEIGNFTEKEFRIMIVKMIQDLRKRMEAKIEKMQEIFNNNLEELNIKDLEELKKKETEMNNTITEMKNTLEESIAEELRQKNG